MLRPLLEEEINLLCAAEVPGKDRLGKVVSIHVVWIKIDDSLHGLEQVVKFRTHDNVFLELLNDRAVIEENPHNQQSGGRGTVLTAGDFEDLSMWEITEFDLDGTVFHRC